MSLSVSKRGFKKVLYDFLLSKKRFYEQLSTKGDGKMLQRKSRVFKINLFTC